MAHPLAMQTPALGTKAHARLVRSFELRYERAIRAEEGAADERAAWRLAAKSERALRELRLVAAGQPLPVKLSKAKTGFAFLAAIGRVIGRAVRAASALAKARRAVKAVAAGAKRAIRSIVSLVMPTPTPEPTMKEHRFETSGEAYDACQCDDEIKDGDVLIVESERVVGIAHTWPVAVTREHGALHRLADGYSRPVDAELHEGWGAALAVAARLGFEVRS